MVNLDNYPNLDAIVRRQLSLWPAHERYINASFSNRSSDVLDVSEQVAELVVRLAENTPGGLDRYCDDYRFLCEEVVLPEELYFRRYGHYRLSSFAEAFDEWYSQDEKMGRYMGGLLVSNVLWDAHACAVAHYVTSYLSSLPLGATHLEIGPGHGLLLCLAARSPALRTITGWDISKTSIKRTREAIQVMGVDRPVTLELRNLFDRADDVMGAYDGVVVSEILEHLEDPLAALGRIRELLRPDGRVWINVPVNSPAPDHIYLLRSPEEACQLAIDAGFKICDYKAFPAAGSTLDRARRQELSISCAITAQR